MVNHKQNDSDDYTYGLGDIVTVAEKCQQQREVER